MPTAAVTGLGSPLMLPETRATAPAATGLGWHHAGPPTCAALVRGSVATPMLLLWGYLAYWCTLAGYTWHDTPAETWLTAAAVAAIVGVALNAAALDDQQPVLLQLRKQPFRCVRFFLIPFCVSSLSAISEMNGDDFVLMFPKESAKLIAALGATLVVPLSLRVIGGCCVSKPQASLVQHPVWSADTEPPTLAV